MLGSRRTPCLGLAFLALVTLGVSAQEKPGRLSNRLLEQPPARDSYPAGLSWRVQGEQPSQQILRDELLQSLDATPSLRALSEWIRTLPVTGRVPVANSDARWLIVHPNRDPVLGPGQTIVVPQRPRTVTVVTAQGERCAVTHAAGREAIAYVSACSPRSTVDWAWIAQPDGRVERYGIAPWNREAQDEPAPGAWIWAPGRNERVPERLSDRLIRFLATQGPAPDAIALEPGFSSRGRSSALLANDWGETGLLQTPTARIAPAGMLTAQIGHVWPYSRGNVFVAPFDWLEAGFRYTDIANRSYLAEGGGQTAKDKSFDAKFRLWRESRYVPEVAVGFRDVAGTGLFSSEYLAGSKRYGPLDFTLGAGWGYMAGKTRAIDVGEGGTLDFGRYFRGGAAFFGGVQYQTPLERLVVKIERDANNYQAEPLDNNQPQSTHWNFGLTWRAARGVDLSAGVERGNRLMIGIAFYSKLDELYTPKPSDPPRCSIATRRRRSTASCSSSAGEASISRSTWSTAMPGRRSRPGRCCRASGSRPGWGSISSTTSAAPTPSSCTRSRRRSGCASGSATTPGSAPSGGWASSTTTTATRPRASASCRTCAPTCASTSPPRASRCRSCRPRTPAGSPRTSTTASTRDTWRRCSAAPAANGSGGRSPGRARSASTSTTWPSATSTSTSASRTTG